MTLTIIKFVCLLLGIWFTIVNIGRLKCRQDVSSTNTFLQALGITGFIFLQFFM